MNVPHVLVISHILTLGIQHLELAEGRLTPWQGLTLSAYYTSSKFCGFSSYCNSEPQTLSEIHHGNRDTERCLLLHLSSLIQEACFQLILLQYSRPQHIMCQKPGVHFILEKNASLNLTLEDVSFFCCFFDSQTATHFSVNKCLPNSKCTDQASPSYAEVKLKSHL